MVKNAFADVILLTSGFKINKREGSLVSLTKSGVPFREGLEPWSDPAALQKSDCHKSYSSFKKINFANNHGSLDKNPKSQRRL